MIAIDSNVKIRYVLQPKPVYFSIIVEKRITIATRWQFIVLLLFCYCENIRKSFMYLMFIWKNLKKFKAGHTATKLIISRLISMIQKTRGSVWPWYQNMRRHMMLEGRSPDSFYSLLFWYHEQTRMQVFDMTSFFFVQRRWRKKWS